ncbi:MAG: hypothetical protein NTW86_21155 [Candidatus Sumerlaeota bacterium]|nr:hypothetical protein [Candidatus Sumerlaeota bacterium]
MNEDTIRQMLSEIRSHYTHLFVQMERALGDGPDAPAGAQLENLNAEIANRMVIVEGKMRRLRLELGDWPNRRDLSPPLRGEVEGFFNLLEKGLQALQKRLEAHVARTRQEHRELAEAIRALQRNRRGVRHYRAAGRGAKLLNSEA